MMVITAMATGVVLSTAYVASRSNGMVVGANFAASSQARVEAESSLALTIVALTTNDRWRNEHRDGVLYERNQDGVSVRVELLDLASCDVPDANTVDVKAVVTTNVEGVERVAEADFFVPLPIQSDSIDVDLGEFAMFAGDSITVRSEAVVEPWAQSPAISRGDPIRVATAEGNLGGVELEGAGTIVCGIEYAPGSRSSSSGSLPVNRMPDGVAVPLPAPPRDLSGAQHLDAPVGRLDVDARVDELELLNGTVLELASGTDLLIEGDLVLGGGALLRISGDSQVVVHGDARVHDARIEVGVDASLVMHVGGDLDFRHATVVEPGGDEETWVPEIDRVRFVPLAVRETIPLWRVRGRSLVKGEFYAPSVEFKLQGRAVLIGRIAAQNVLLEGRSCLLYDPALDDRNGYTALDERAYDQQGDLLEALETLEDLSEQSLAEASEELGLAVGSSGEYATPPAEEEIQASAQEDRYREWWRFGRWRPRLWNGGYRANRSRHNGWSVQIRSIGVGFGG
jgi:hypothetical protein